MLNAISIVPSPQEEVTSSGEAMSWDIATANNTFAHGGRARKFLTKAGSFFTELKRRRVYRVAAAYAVASWLLVQAASIFLPTFDAPPCVMRAVVVFLMLGLIVSAVLSWVFDITPQGIKRTADISQDEAVDIVRQLEAQARREFVRGYLSAVIYAGLGDKTKAIDYLEREYLGHEHLEHNNIDPAVMSVDAMLDELRSDPRSEALAARQQ